MSKAAQRSAFILAALPSILLAVSAFLGCSSTLADQRQDTPVHRVRVVKVYPHDANAFTQGLEVEGETLYEGTGKYGGSTLRRVELSSGETKLYQKLPQNYFGEGISILNGKIYQLTWKERKCAVYEKESLKYIRYFDYSGQGWGLANDGKHLYMSDGTSSIRVVDPDTFKVIRKIRVKEGRKSIDNLNELEFFDGHLYANIWYKDYIAKIDPESGAIVAWIDCSNVYPAKTRPNVEHVLNGIAHDAESGRLFITGKRWPRLYEIEILDK